MEVAIFNGFIRRQVPCRIAREGDLGQTIVRIQSRGDSLTDSSSRAKSEFQNTEVSTCPSINEFRI